MLTRALLLATLALGSATAVAGQSYVYDPTSTVYDPDYTNTYSIIVRDPETGELGIGVASRVLAVGRNGSSFKGGVAVIVHQASSDPYYGRIGMEMIDAGLDPQEVMARLVRSDTRSESRQVAMLDAQGRAAAFTGGGPVGQAVYSHPRASPEDGWKGHRCGVDYCAQANTMLGPEVVENMANSFEATRRSGKPLAERIIDAMDAGLSQGADIRGQQSAALFIVKKLAGAGGYSDVAEDLRVNDHPHPVTELRRLYVLRQSGGIIAEANRRFEAGERDAALRDLFALRDQIPTSDAVWIAIAGMHTRMDQRKEALAAIAKAIELNPYNARTMQGGLPRNRTFAPLYEDAEWKRIMAVWPLKDPSGTGTSASRPPGR
jgi:uncharacterized Ntn-hydrolase superfamily protein